MMPVNPGYDYKEAEKRHLEAVTLNDKIRTLQEMLRKVPKHKSSEKLQQQLKEKLSKLKALSEKEKKTKRGRGGLTIKKEGVAQIVLIGKTNSGKSFVLNKLTNANVEEASYEYTTKKPMVGVLDYNTVKLQLVEIPAITENFMEKEKGPMYLGIVRGSDLVVMVVRNEDDIKFLSKELSYAGIDFDGIILLNENLNFENVKERIWRSLNLVYVFTKTPGKNKDLPAVALKEGNFVSDLARMVHKDFLKKFKYAKVWGSVKHQGMHVGLNHVLKSGDVVEFHLK